MSGDRARLLHIDPRTGTHHVAWEGRWEGVDRYELVGGVDRAVLRYDAGGPRPLCVSLAEEGRHVSGCTEQDRWQRLRSPVASGDAVWSCGHSHLLRHDITGAVTRIDPPPVRHPGTSMVPNQAAAVDGGVIVEWLSADVSARSHTIVMDTHERILARYTDETQQWDLLARGVRLRLLGSHGRYLIGALMADGHPLAVYNTATHTLRVSEVDLGPLPQGLVVGDVLYRADSSEGLRLAGMSMALAD